MRNINELIGIIKGINFDGVINDKEVLRLQSWVDKNRNLTYDKKQSELIRLVDTVLEDYVIDDDERDLLIEKAEEFLSEVGDKSGKIYELNGIIEGVICDDEVNESEIYRLKEWMKDNSDVIREHKSTAELCATIDDILEDGVVTEDEQQHLLEILTERIKNTQFETKLDYLCRQVKARKNIGPDLIDILDNESAMSEIHNRAELQILAALASYSNYCRNQEIVVVSLVLIAMLEYDGNYYGNVRSTYTKVYARHTEQKVEGFIRSLLSKYKKQDASGSRTRIINVALENAIVPQTYLSAFFEFIFDIYERNFEYDLPQDPYEDFLFVFEGLRNNMLSDGDDIRLDVTQKTYKLIATTKQMIAREDGLDAVIKLSILIIKLIDKRFWDKEVKIFNPYLKVGYDGWEEQLKETAHSRRLQRIEMPEFRSRWEPKYCFRDNNIYLYPPIHRVKAQYDYQDIAIIVLNDGEEIYHNDTCDIRNIIGGYQVNSPQIMIDRPLGKLKYRLVAGDEIIYDSRDKLYRNYIVFNAEGQEINNNTDFEGEIFVCSKKGEVEIDNIVSKDFYCIGYKLVRTGDVIGIGNDIFNFSAMLKPGIFGQLHNNCYVCKVNFKDYMPVYKEVNVVMFEADNTSTKFEININGKPYKLSEFIHKTTIRDAITKYVVSLDLKECGLYTVEINQLLVGKKNRILRNQFVYDNALEFKVENLDDSAYRLQIVSDLLEDKIDMEMTVDEFDLDFIEFTYKGEYYNYMLPLDTGYYKVDDGEWCSVKEDMWIDDISLKSELIFYDSECNGLMLYTENGVLVEDNIEVKDRGFYKVVPIGFLNSYKVSNKYTVLAFTVDGKVKHKLFCYNKCEIVEEATEIAFSDEIKKIMVTPVFHGKNKVFFEMFNKEGERVYKSKELASGQTETFQEFNSFEEYKFNFHEKTRMMMLRKNTLLHTMNRTFYAREDYVGKVFKINTVYFNQFYRGNYVEKPYHFNKAYVRITEVADSDVFLGEVFVKTMRGEWNLDGVNPVEIEICSEIIDDTMDVYITNCGDGLLLDFEKHGILNAMEHPTAPDIFLYTVGMKEEE